MIPTRKLGGKTNRILELLNFNFQYFFFSLNAKFFEYCNPTLLTTLRETMLQIDDKWSKVHEKLLEDLALLRKEASALSEEEQLSELADDLDELKASEKRKLSSMSTDETLLDEFRTAFQEVSLWINKAEAGLGTNRESQEKEIGQELDQIRPKMGNLRRMAEKLVQLFVSQREDVEPEMNLLAQRWEHIAHEVEKRIQSNQAFRMVEVEEIKTTIAHLSIPLSEPVVTIVTQPSPIVDPDEEIETLIEVEEDSSQTNNNHKSSSEGSLTDTVKSPSPPKPLPKPRWYLEQRAQVKMPLSPEKVKVIQNTLPSPQNPVGKVESQLQSPEKQMPEHAVLASTSTTPSTTLDSPASTVASVFDEDTLLAKENAIIDHLLAETELQLEEVARHVRGLSTNKDKDLIEFEAKCKSVIEKIEQASRKIDEVEREQDLALRKDLVAMEVKMLEPEVNSLLSRADTLAMICKKRSNNSEADAVSEQKSDLKNVWKTLVARTEATKSTIAETGVKLKQFRKELDLLKRWLSSAKVKLVRAANDERVAKQLVAEVRNRKSDVDHLNLLASQLQHRNALGGQEMALNFINSDWEEIVERIKPLQENHQNNASSLLSSDATEMFTTPGSPLMRSAPVEVATRMAKMLDALAAVDRQLDTQTLGTERPCENLGAQSDALNTVKNALDRLRPTLKQTDQDLDRLSSAKLSMEYFEKLSNSNSKLHKEWDRVRYRFAQRQELWNASKRLETELQVRKHQLEMWLRGIVNEHSAVMTNEEVETKGKLVADLAGLCKDFMNKTSAQEALAIQAEVDGLLRKWRNLLAVLTSERKAAFGLCERVDKLSLLLSQNINPSDSKALRDAIKELNQCNISELRRQFAQRINDEGMRDPALLKARTTAERLALTIPRKLEVLREKQERLMRMEETRARIHGKIQELSSQAKHVKADTDGFRSVQLSVANLQYEVNRLLTDYVSLERECSTNSCDFEPQPQVQALKSAWLQLSIDSRQHITSHLNDLESNVNDFVNSSNVNSPCSTTNESFVNSPTTCSSQSSFMSDESQLDFDQLAAQIEKELQKILEEATQLNLAVHDPVAIRAVVDQQQKVMRQLETKRDSLETLGPRLQVSKNSLLQSRLGVLRDQLDVTKHRVLSRKSECTAMASDSDQFARKLKEIESWLGRLDSILQSTHPLGQTLDVLEHQHQAAMDALKELSKYEHHVRLFMQVCERMCHVYGRDDTSRIQEARNNVEGKHKSLANEFTKRRNEIQAVQNSFSSFDKSVERFFEWLFDVELNVEQLNEDENPPQGARSVLVQRFEDIKNEIHDKDRVFNALNSTGNSLMNKMAEEERTMLSQKLAEMRSRWKSLQNKMLDINLNLRPKNNSDGTEALEDLSNVSLEHAKLRDHMDWVLRKKRELSSLSLDGDVKGLRRQMDEHEGFRHQLSERGTAIRNSLNVAFKLADKVHKPDFSECLANLELEWRELNDRSNEWQDDIVRMTDNVKGYEDRIKELNKL